MQFTMPTRTTLDKALMLLETVDQREKLTNIKCPVLRLYGRLDSLVPKKIIPLMHKLLVESDSYLFENSSHAPFISEQEKFIDVLKTWLAKIN